MYKDAKEELKRLEAQLLAEEDDAAEETASAGSDFSDEELEQIKALLKDPEVPIRNYANGGFSVSNGKTTLKLAQLPEDTPEPPVRNFANNYTAYTAGNTEVNAEELSRALLEDEEADRKAGNRLMVLAMCLLAGILGILVWWLIRFRGLL